LRGAPHSRCGQPAAGRRPRWATHVADKEPQAEEDDGHFWPRAVGEHVVQVKLAEHGLPQCEDGAPKVPAGACTRTAWFCACVRKCMRAKPQMLACMLMPICAFMCHLPMLPPHREHKTYTPTPGSGCACKRQRATATVVAHRQGSAHLRPCMQCARRHVHSLMLVVGAGRL